jgi:hypothetical protein
MTRKTQVTEGGNTIIKNTNAHNTWTAQAVKHPLVDYAKTFEPDTGVNAVLLEDIKGIIEATPHLWEQGVWRTVHKYSSRSLIGQVFLKTSAFTQEETQPVCGTTMCVAGWAAELTGADWLVDASVITAAKAGGEFDLFDLEEVSQSALWVTKEWYEENMAPSAAWIAEAHDLTVFQWSRLPKAVLFINIERGFSPETHVLVEASAYARVMLGIKDDMLELFSGSNTKESVSEKIDLYINKGADWTEREAHDVLCDC